MNRICLLHLLFLISSMELNAQADYSETPGKDSVNIAPLDLIMPDSNYYPPCILPLEPEAKIPVFNYNIVSSFDSGCHAKGAKKDLKNGKAIIWFPGGIFGCDFSSKTDQEFQNRYQVRFISPGCCRFGDEDPEAYNQVIFEYLDKKYGTGWRDELRHDAEGFKAPKTSNIVSSVSLNNSVLSMEFANKHKSMAGFVSPETETSILWYILPTSGFALLLSLYFIIKRRKKN